MSDWELFTAVRNSERFGFGSTISNEGASCSGFRGQYTQCIQSCLT